MKREPTVIGSKADVDFPELGIFVVPAKIDTGADSSSIWASNVEQSEPGVLRFSLFAQGSPFYTGERLSTTDYTLISVKNSFGQTEYRYKVKLQVKVGGRLIRSHFTLADRSKNSQPALIGRQTLKNKFIVDVARSEKTVRKRLLVLSQFMSDNVADFLKGVQGHYPQLSVTQTTYDDLLFLYEKRRSHIKLRSSGEDVADFDIVHLKTSVERDVTAAVARYAEQHGRKVIDREAVRQFPTTSKLYQYTILVGAGIPVPQTIFMMPAAYVEDGAYERLVTGLGAPFVLKDIHTSKGRNNEVIRSEAEYEKMVRRALDDNVYLVAQRFVPNEGDYRFLVMGQTIALAIWRRRIGDASHLNNTSQGGSSELRELKDIPSKVQIQSLKAAKLLQRDIAGVDMVQDTSTGDWYCFEVNDGPQIATGTFTLEKQEAYAAFIKRELEK